MAKNSGSLRSYLLTRLLLVVPNVWILLTVVFVLMRVAPGDPVQAAQGGRLPPDQIKALRHAGGFDKPLIVQYKDYIGQVLQGNLGHSSSENRSVWSIVTHEGAATLELSVFALTFALVVGITIGSADRAVPRHAG